MNVKPVQAITILVIVSILVWVGIWIVSGNSPDLLEASEQNESVNINVKDTSWFFQGTYCSECNYLYNYDKYPKICEKCGKPTKKLYYLVLIKEQN